MTALKVTECLKIDKIRQITLKTYSSQTYLYVENILIEIECFDFSDAITFYRNTKSTKMELLKTILEKEMPIVITKNMKQSHTLKDITHIRVSGVLL